MQKKPDVIAAVILLWSMACSCSMLWWVGFTGLIAEYPERRLCLAGALGFGSVVFLALAFWMRRE